MSFATYDPTTDLGYVRLLIDDTDSTDYHFEDAEITAFLSQTETASGENQLLKAAATALKSWAGKLLKDAELNSTAEWSRDNRQQAKDMLALARQYTEDEDNKPYSGDAEIAQTDWTAGVIVANKALRE